MMTIIYFSAYYFFMIPGVGQSDGLRANLCSAEIEGFIPLTDSGLE